MTPFTFTSKLAADPGARFRLRREGAPVGEFTMQELMAAQEGGLLQESDELCIEGSAQWVPLRDINKQVMADFSKDRWGILRGAIWPQRRLPGREVLLSAAPVGGCLGGAVLWLGGIGGGGIIALVLIVVYLWGTISMNRGGAQEQHLDELRDRIVAYVDTHPEFVADSADAMASCPVITDEDREVIRDTEASLHPVDARSGPEALVLSRPLSDGARLYYKNGETEAQMRWRSPVAQELYVEAEPRMPPGSGRIVRLRRDQATLAEYETGAFSVHAMWRRDGKFAAVNESSRGPNRFTVLTADSFGALLPPESIEPPQLLAQEQRLAAEQGMEVRWASDQVRAVRWLPSGELEVESFGNISVIEAESPPRRFVTIRQTFFLSINAEGTISVARSDSPVVHRSAPGQ